MSLVKFLQITDLEIPNLFLLSAGCESTRQKHPKNTSYRQSQPHSSFGPANDVIVNCTYTYRYRLDRKRFLLTRNYEQKLRTNLDVDENDCTFSVSVQNPQPGAYDLMVT